MNRTALAIAFYGCIAAFAVCAMAAFFIPGMAAPLGIVALVAGTAAGPLGNRLDRTRG